MHLLSFVFYLSRSLLWIFNLLPLRFEVVPTSERSHQHLYFIVELLSQANSGAKMLKVLLNLDVSVIHIFSLYLHQT